MSELNSVSQFFRAYAASTVGATPPQPAVAPDDDDEETPEKVALDLEMPPDSWKPLIIGEAPARQGEHPERFIDGSQHGQPIICLRSPQGWPIPLVLSEVGAVALQLRGRTFVREFVAVEKILSFVADPFPWEEVEAFAGALANDPRLAIRVVPAKKPDLTAHSPFDYELMRSQAHNRCQQEMLNFEVLALATAPETPTLVDGQLGGRIGEAAAAARPLLVGAVKRPTPKHLHEEGYRTLLSLRPGQRTPYFKITGTGGGRQSDLALVSWYLKLSGGSQLAPNWGFIRVDVPWVQFKDRPDQRGFADRLSRWLIDARCRTKSYMRMPVSLEPIVRAEDVLKPLFTPLQALANRLYRQAGNIGSF